MLSDQTAVLLLKLALEKGLGRKNLTSASVSGGYLFYKLKNASYAVDIATLEVFRTFAEENDTRLFVDDYSMMTQEYLKNLLNDEQAVMKLADEYMKGN